MKKNAKRNSTRRTGRVVLAGGELPHTPCATESQKIFQAEILDAQKFLQGIDDSRLKEWLKNSHAKRPCVWDKVAVFKDMLLEPSWLNTDASGKVINAHIQAFNEYQRRSEKAFRVSLEELQANWKTEKGRIEEAEHLVPLATDISAGTFSLAAHTAILKWEFARYLFAHEELHEYQMIKSSGGELIQNYGYQEPFDHPLFPHCPWCDLPAADRKFLTAQLAGHVDQAVRILSLEEWWPSLGFVSRKRYDSTLKDGLKAEYDEGPPARIFWEHPLETEANEVSYIVVRVDWRERENTLKEALMGELKRVRPEWTPTKSPGRGPERESRSLRGLAFQWLKDTRLSLSKKANLIYPRQLNPSKKGAPTDDASSAGKCASSKLEAFKAHFLERVPSAYVDLRDWNDNFADRLRSGLPPV